MDLTNEEVEDWTVILLMFLNYPEYTNIDDNFMYSILIANIIIACPLLTSSKDTT